jgi:kynurenine formamidase
MDAPAHFAQGKRTIDAIPLGELVVPAVVIDARDRVSADPDFQLGADDVRAWEAQHGEVPAGSLVILNTGWHLRFADPGQYVNADDVKTMHFPGFGTDSAALLIERGVVGIGIDTLSLDHGPSKDFATHNLMLGADKYMLENLANLDALPATGAWVIVGVLPVADGTQAQARVLAILP